jgi:hypothetical protein
VQRQWVLFSREVQKTTQYYHEDATTKQDQTRKGGVGKRNEW